MTEKPVRTRYAPSPTGPQHIGGVRTALFTWMFARHHGGQFILRLEDTDQSRFVEGAEELIYSSLQWIGIDWDEGPDVGGDYGPYIQSQRLDMYQEWAQWLIEHDYAYKAFETSEELQQISEARAKQGLSQGYDGRARNLTKDEVAVLEADGKSFVVRFKMPQTGKTIGEDVIRGKVEFDNTTLNDPVLLKSDGYPTYHFAHVIDDHFMEISHVTRGIEWLPSLPIHWNLWEAFGWGKPVYAHMPVILNPNGEGKLSKRHHGMEVDGVKIPVLAQDFIDYGYVPDAARNFLTNVGWNFGDNEEVFTTEEAIKRFELADVNASNSAYPVEKLDWLNGVYIREMDATELAKCLRPHLESANYEVNNDLLLQVAPIVQVRIKTLNDVVEMAGFFFADWEAFVAPDPELIIHKKLTPETTMDVLEKAIEVLNDLDDLAHDVQYEAFKAAAKDMGVKNGPMFNPIRVAVTGQQVSTPTFETIEILGKDESIRRIRLAIDAVKQVVTS